MFFVIPLEQYSVLCTKQSLERFPTCKYHKNPETVILQNGGRRMAIFRIFTESRKISVRFYVTFVERLYIKVYMFVLCDSFLTHQGTRQLHMLHHIVLYIWRNNRLENFYRSTICNHFFCPGNLSKITM